MKIIVDFIMRSWAFIIKRAGRVSGFMLAIYITMIGIDALGEITERQKIIEFINNKEKSFITEISTLTVQTGEHQIINLSEVNEIQNSIEMLKKQKEILTFLIIHGSNSNNQNLQNIIEALLKHSDKRQENILSNTDKNERKEAPNKMSISRLWHSFFIRQTIDETSSELLLVYLILCASVLGALVDSLRDDNVSVLETLVNGVGAGIICFLAIKSGTLDYTALSNDSMQNPYFNSFLGFLGGFFSTDVFKSLRSLAGAIYKKFQHKKVE